MEKVKIDWPIINLSLTKKVPIVKIESPWYHSIFVVVVVSQFWRA